MRGPGDTLVPSLRPATAEDAAVLPPMVQDLYSADGVHSIPPAHLDRTLSYLSAHPDMGCLYMVEVLEAGLPSVAGYVILANWWSHEHGGKVALLDELYLLPRYRGKGLGARVMDLLEEMCRSQSMSVMYLEVESRNRRAIRLYEARKFVASPRTHMLKLL